MLSGALRFWRLALHRRGRDFRLQESSLPISRDAGATKAAHLWHNLVNIAKLQYMVLPLHFLRKESHCAISDGVNSRSAASKQAA
eukprot:3381273-Pleurochrysis_carterae.AAC.2